ncbi:MAG: replication factor C small subunit [Candidatus Aenigmatarchaeota archaeon]
MQEIWTEKYRPKVLTDIVGQELIIRRLSSLLEKKDLPHCLFSGNAGTGKTTTSLAMAQEIFGNSWKGNFLELNASDERGIDIIREKVKDFARTMPLGANFKIIYLDEADSLTKDAQHALRRIMESYSNTCRFILSCNYSSKIIPPIQSRCAIFRFAALKEEDVLKYLKLISESEKLNIDDDTMKTVFEASEGDMRKAVNILQTASADMTSKPAKGCTDLKCATTAAGIIDKHTIYSLANKDPEHTAEMINTAIKGKFPDARKLLHHLLENLSGEDVIKEIHNQTINLDLPNEKKIKLIEKIGECEFRITEGSNPKIQIESLLAQMGIL